MNGAHNCDELDDADEVAIDAAQGTPAGAREVSE